MNKTNMKKLHTTIIIIILQIVVCGIVLFGQAQQSFGQNFPSLDSLLDPGSYDIWCQGQSCPADNLNVNVDFHKDNGFVSGQNDKITDHVLTDNVAAVITPSNPIVFTPQVGLPGFMSRYAFTSQSTVAIAQLMKELFKYGVQIIMVLALIVIIIGGFLWSTAGGNGQKVTEAKQWIFSGLGGLCLALFAYLILRTININLVNFKPTSIQAVSGLAIDTKSNQDQVTDDRGFLDGIYAKTFGSINNLNSEACCVVYNQNTLASSIFQGKPDALNVASVAYSTIEDNFGEVRTFCLDYANQMTGERNGKKYTPTMQENSSGNAIYISLSKDDELNEKSFTNWEQEDFTDYVEDLALFIVKDSACWGLNSKPFQEASQGLNNPNYCKNKNDGWACIVEENQTKWWGYCESAECHRCLSYGQSCSKDYQCPEDRRIIGNSTIIKGWQCGNKGASGLVNNKYHNCDSSHMRCACKNQKCYDECATNAANLNNTSAVADVCKK